MSDEDEKDSAKPELTSKGIPEHSAQAITASVAFGGLLQARNMEAQLRWIGFQSAVALNVAGSAGLLLFLRASAEETNLTLAQLACIAGVFFNFVHYKILGRDGKFMELWNQKLTELEQANGIEGNVRIFTSVRYLNLRSRTPTIQEVLRFCVMLCALLWMAGGIWLIISRFFFGG